MSQTSCECLPASFIECFPNSSRASDACSSEEPRLRAFIQPTDWLLGTMPTSLLPHMQQHYRTPSCSVSTYLPGCLSSTVQLPKPASILSTRILHRKQV